MIKDLKLPGGDLFHIKHHMDSGVPARIGIEK